MAKRDMIDDLVDIFYPMPAPLHEDADDNERDAHWAECNEADQLRRTFEENLRLQEEHAEDLGGYRDPLLNQILEARSEMREAEARMRLLVAYGREFVRPQPYQLKDLAASTGMSISGTRGAYTVEEIATVARRIGRQPRFRAEDTGE